MEEAGCFRVEAACRRERTYSTHSTVQTSQQKKGAYHSNPKSSSICVSHQVTPLLALGREEEEEEEGGGSLISVPTSGGDCLRGLMRERGRKRRERGEKERERKREGEEEYTRL